VFGIIGVVVLPVVVRLVDLRGGKGLMLVGTALLLATMLLFGQAHGASSLFLLRVLHGIGWAAFSTASSALVALIAPTSRRGEAMGYFGMSTSVAMAVAPAIGLAIAHKGYPLLFLASAGLVLAAGMSTLPVGDRKAAIPAPASGLQGFLLRAALLPSLVAGISTLTYAAVMFYIEEYANHFHLGNAGLFFTVLAVTLVITRGPLGRLSDRIGREWVIGAGLACSAAGAALLAIYPDRWMLLVGGRLRPGYGGGAAHPDGAGCRPCRSRPTRRRHGHLHHGL
jgi:MFS family permease